MLLRQNRCRHQHSDLFSVLHRFERRAQSHFGFAIAHITAQQAIHRTRSFHIALNGGNRAALVGSFNVWKAIFQLFLPGRICAKSVTRNGLPFGVQFQQFFGHLLHRFFDVGLGSRPFLRAEPRQRGNAALLAHITRQPVGLMHGDKNLVALFIFNA